MQTSLVAKFSARWEESDVDSGWLSRSCTDPMGHCCTAPQTSEVICEPVQDR